MDLRANCPDFQRNFYKSRSETGVVYRHLFLVYRVIQEESARLWEMIVCVILSKKVHINMCPILDGYGVMTVF